MHTTLPGQDRPAFSADLLHWAGIAGRAHGDPGAPGRPLVFLHGLSFDHRMWDPVLDALPTNHRAVAFDLPGHGGTPALGTHHVDDVVDALHAAVLDAGLQEPVIVGHSMGAGIAAMYALEHGAAAVVNVDSPLRLGPFAQHLHAVATQLRGDDFPRAWSMFWTSMHVERVPEPYRDLLRAGEHVAQELVLSYWAELLDRSVDDTVRWLDDVLNRPRTAHLAYLWLCRQAPDPQEQAWAAARGLDVETIVWPVGHHFPHLADPRRFAELLTALLAAPPATSASSASK